VSLSESMGNNMRTKINYIKWITLGIIVGFMCCSNNTKILSPVIPEGDFKYTIGSYQDRTDNRLYVLGLITNASDETLAPVPMVGVYENLEATDKIREYIGVISEDNVLTPHNTYLYTPDKPRNPPYIDPGETLYHLTITDPINTLLPTGSSAFWYFWWDNHGQTSKPILITRKTNKVMIHFDKAN